MQHPVIAYPISSPQPTKVAAGNKNEMMNQSSLSGEMDIFSTDMLAFADHNSGTESSMEMSGNFLSQLDSMIAAVKVESSALDSMRDKLKEIETLRTQLANFSKRILDADQANLNLKTNMLKLQEAYNELKKSKAEVESNVVPLRQELNRVKEAHSKERMGRLSAQQEISVLKDQVMRLEKINEGLVNENKVVPGLVESNEILKNDIAQLRRRFKEDKSAAQKQIQMMESQARDVDAVKNDVRVLALRLLDISSNGVSTNMSSNSQQSQQQPPQLSPENYRRYQQQQQQQQQQQVNSYKSKVSYEHDGDDHDDYDDDIGVNGDASIGDDYDNNSFLEESSIHEMISYGGNGPSSSSNMINNGNGKMQQYGSEKIGNASGGVGGKGVKKVQKKRRQINVSGGGGANIGGGGNMLNSNSAGNVYVTEQSSYRHGNMNNDGINLPRIN